VKQSEQVPSLPLPESVDAMVESGEIEKAAKLARKGFDIWSHGPSLVRAGDLWVKAGDLIQAKDCYELFLLRCGQENTISKAVRSSLSSVNKKIKMSQKKSAVSNKQFSIIPSIIAKWGASLISFIKFDEAEKNKISVIMTTYNSKKFVGKAIESILSQTHSNLELVIVDDASTDGTFQILETYSNKDSRIKLIKNFVNKGTYCSKNLGVIHSSGEFITTQDSDDISDKKRLELQLKEFTKNPKIKVCSCNYIRINLDGDIVINRGLKERLAIMCLMWEKETVINKLGFFDSVRTSADAEFFDRLKIAFSKEEFSHVNRALIKLLHRKDSLTTQPESKVNIDSIGDESPDDLGFLSPPRRAYVKSYRKWHEKIKNGDASPHISYPLLQRKFEAPESLHPSPKKHDEYVTASLASMQSRSGSLEKVIESILPQVDHLDVYLNGYGEIPSYLDDKKINVARSQKYGDQRDNGKFFFLSTLKHGYHFTIDDDILYPPDYVQKNILKLNQYNLQVAVGSHSSNMPIPLERFFGDRTVYHFRRELKQDKFVNLLGTGTLAYHTSTIKLTFENFREPGMADVWFAVAAKKQNIPLVTIEHDKNWLVALETGDNTLYSEFKKNDTIQTKIMQEHRPWSLFEQYELYKDIAHRLLHTYTESELRSRSVDVDYLRYILYLPVLKGSFGEWSISKTLFDIIHEMLKPGDKILEFGSGWGTGQLIKNFKVFSVEDNTDFLNIYDTNYIHAPIVKVKNNLFPKDKGWYDTEVLKKSLPKDYNLILVDGPWGHIGRGGFAKYLDLFREDVPIIIDDVQRENEMALTKFIEKRRKVRKKIYTAPHLEKERIAKQFAVLVPY